MGPISGAWSDRASSVRLSKSTSMATALVAMIASVAASADLAAQNEVLLNPGEIRYSSRGDLGDRGGEYLQGFHTSHWRGLGHRGSRGRITAFRAFSLQDAQRGTPEKFRWIVRTGGDSIGPTPGTPGEIFRSGEVQLGPALGGGSVAWDVTTRLRTPVEFRASRFVAIGVRVPPTIGARYHLDGLSCWIGASLGGKDDNRAARWAPDQAWQFIDGTTAPSHPSGRRTWRIGFESDAPTLQFGNVIGSGPWPVRFGSGGLFPDDGQGLAYRVHAAGRDGDFAILFASVSDFNVVSVPIFGSAVWLEWHGILPGLMGAAQVQSGVAGGILTPKLPRGLPRQLTWQCVVINANTAQASLTNAAKTSH